MLRNAPRIIGFLGGFALAFATQAHASTVALGRIETGAIGAFQFQGQSQGNSLSGLVRWTPAVDWGRGLGANLNLGFSLFKSRAASVFPVLDTTIVGSYALGPRFCLGPVLGFQHWLGGYGGAGFAAGVQGRWMKDFWLEVIHVRQATPTTEVSLGVRVDLESFFSDERPAELTVDPDEDEEAPELPEEYR